MNDEKLEDFKVMSATAAIIFGCGTAIGIGAEIDAYKNGGVSILPLLLIFSILTVISLIMALVSGHILKKRQGEEYFSAKDYITGFISMWFPNLTASHSAELRQLNVSDDNKKTKLWKRLCSGYDLDCIISFILWFSLWSLCVWMLIRCIFFSNVTDKIFEIVCYSIVVIMILVVLICVGSGIKKIHCLYLNTFLFREKSSVCLPVILITQRESFIRHGWIMNMCLFKLWGKPIAFRLSIMKK